MSTGRTSTEWAARARLLRRTSFGATGAAVDAALPTATPAFVQALLAADPEADPGALRTPMPTFEPVPAAGRAAGREARQARNRTARGQVETLTAWWVQRMVTAEQSFGEKLTFGWHGHFATSSAKVRQAGWLGAQNTVLRRLGRGSFRPLALAMLTDAAMLDWLDGEKNTAGAANENLSREFMELFALGHGGGYTETDVREGARALTGWKIHPDGSTFRAARAHDNGSKTLLGVTGDLDETGYCDAVLARAAGPRYLATRWWGRLVDSAPPTAQAVDRAVAGYGPDRSLTGLLTALLTAPELTAPGSSLVQSPVEWLIGAVRVLAVPAPSDQTARRLVTVLRGLGQVPFDPPSVGGWPTGQAWLSTAAADLRLRAAGSLVRAGDLSAVSDVPAAARLDAAAHLLALPGWSPSTAAVLRTAAGDPGRLLVLALTSPEHLTA